MNNLRTAARNTLKDCLRIKVGEQFVVITEFAIGTNDQAIITGFTLEDENVMGTVHIAVGDNSSFGGKIEVNSHLDGIINKPTLFICGDKIIDEGKSM